MDYDDEQSLFDKFKPVARVTQEQRPSPDAVSRLAPGQYIAWKKDEYGSTSACVQASSVDAVHIEFECPFCTQRYNSNGTRKRKPTRRNASHVHGSLGDRMQCSASKTAWRIVATSTWNYADSRSTSRRIRQEANEEKRANE
jgi:transcription elongation factor Elf1